MGFDVSNGFKPVVGLGGTSRVASATFNGDPGQHSAGMGQQPQAPASPAGSSYTMGAGMGGTGRFSNVQLNGTMSKAAEDVGQRFGSDPRYQTNPWGDADIGQSGPQMSEADMQDPANAAMAGFQFAASQDQAPSASTNGPGRPQPPRPPQGTTQSPQQPQQVTQVNTQEASVSSAMQPRQPLNIPRVPVLQR